MQKNSILNIKHKQIIMIYLCLFLLSSCNKQIINRVGEERISLEQLAKKYTSDVFLGSNTEFRNWWNVLHYDIVFTPNYDKKFISGTVRMDFEIIKSDNNGVIQIDLQEPMVITKITQKGVTLDKTAWVRNQYIYLIDTKKLPFKLEDKNALEFQFEGYPKIAKNAPWDGGWIFTKDEKGRPWMSVAVQGMGASAWFPNKDDWGDEPDNGAKISILVPNELVAVANGRLWKSSFVKGDNGSNVYTWEVKNPINNYNIIPYIGYYKNFKDRYISQDGDVLDLDYWVLDYNVEKAKKQFEQVKPMMSAFEDWMGKYPFYEDSYKLVESPYLGMEHQSNVAYGNGYKNGYLGTDRSGSGWGNKFDFIIIHETGHEWFGNNITASDAADMWIHEAFTTYSEVMYVENIFGLKAANEYVQGLKKNILNDSPLVGVYGKRIEGSVDMYNKGANMVHTLRQLVKDDAKFKGMIREMNKKFRHKTVISTQIEKFISDYVDIDLASFFNQYLRQKEIPRFEVKKQGSKTYYKWGNVIKDFNMPIKLKGSNEWIYPTTEWQIYTGKSDLIVDDNFLISK